MFLVVCARLPHLGGCLKKKRWNNQEHQKAAFDRLQRLACDCEAVGDEEHLLSEGRHLEYPEPGSGRDQVGLTQESEERRKE